jgi:predicted outer membrane repeat protein
LTPQKAVNTASENDEIHIKSGTYIISETCVINKSLILKGSYSANNLQDYSEKTILNGNNSYRIMRVITNGSVIPYVTIDGLSFINASSTGYSGALVFDGTRGDVSNCVFTNNQSLIYGGGGIAFLNLSKVSSVSNCLFSKNKGKNGGAIYVGTETNVNIANCTFVNNQSSGGVGGAIWSNGNTTLNNNILWDNKENGTPNQIGGIGIINLDRNIVQGGILSAAEQSDTISLNFAGIGSELGGYDNLKDITGNASLNENDWNTMFTRLRFMRPGLVRIMGTRGWNYSINGAYNPDKSQDILFKILDFCQAENISVIWGEWGHTGGSTIDQTWLNQSINFLDYLINTKKYSCVKYFTMLNEPNGTWSSNDSSYSLWKTLIESTYNLMYSKGLLDKVTIMAPDVTVTRNEFTGVPSAFITNSIKDLDSKIGSYCYHLYPTFEIMESNQMKSTFKAIKNVTPAEKDAHITEIGFVCTANSTRYNRNETLKNADPYAASNANMLVYDAIYGTDMAAAMIQLLNIGYKSVLVWRLDDAMYMTKTTNGATFTRHGFWNSQGKEICNNENDEKMRPWFYTSSLMSRYFPAGSTILRIKFTAQSGLNAIAAVKDGKYTIVVVNSNSETLTTDLHLNNVNMLENMKKFSYKALSQANFEGTVDENGFAVPVETLNVDFSNNSAFNVSIEGNSFILLTNME